MATDVLEGISITLGRQVSAVKDLYLSELETIFRDLGFWGEGITPTWVSRALPVISEAQNVVAELTDAAIDLQFQEMFGDFQPDILDYNLVTGAAVRNGVSPEEVYARALKSVWQSLGYGNGIAASVESGIARLGEMFNTDMERVVDHTGIQRFANENRIVGSKRVLTGTYSCALCIIASTQTYHKRQLKPIHPHCNCKTVPILSFEDHSHVLDPKLVDMVHAEIQKKFGMSDRAARAIDYRKILLDRSHGETGPQLTFRQYNFTGPSGLKE